MRRTGTRSEVPQGMAPNRWKSAEQAAEVEVPQGMTPKRWDYYAVQGDGCVYSCRQVDGSLFKVRLVDILLCTSIKSVEAA